MLNRITPPYIKDAIEFNLHLKAYDLYTLDNGVKVYAINAGAQEVLQLELVFFAGNSFEKKNAVAAATNYLLKNGTTGMNAFQINEHFEYYGAYCNRTCSNETASVTLHTLNKHLPELLPIIREMVSESVFPEEELNIYRQNCQQKLSVNLQKCDFVANRLIDAYLFGEKHPYGKYTVAADYELLNRELLVEHFNQYYLNGNCVIFVAGKLPDNIFEQLNNNFGKLSVKGLPEPIKSLVKADSLYQPAFEKKYRIQNDPNSVQGAVRVGRHFPDRNHPDFMKMMVLNTVMGGYFGSRLMSNIREDKGYTYGIHSYVQNHLGNTALMITTEAGKDVCEATLNEVYHEMKLLREELIDDEELLLVRNYLIGTILGDLNGPFQIIGRWKNIVLNQLTEAYFYESVRTIKEITAEELRSLANVYYRPEDFYELIVV